jgi:hypothetical protein
MNADMEKLQKVLFVQGLHNDQQKVESLWCAKDGENYVVETIPLDVENIARGDLIEVRYVQQENAYYFKKVIKPSGNSTVKVQFVDAEYIPATQESLNALGCDCASSEVRKLLTVNIPRDIDYSQVKMFLDNGVLANTWQYEESCLAHQY